MTFTGAFAPVDYWPLAPVALLLLLRLCRQGSKAEVAWRGWLFGLGLFGSGASWVWVSIHMYGNASVLLATILTLLFCAGLALLPAATLATWCRWLRGRRGGLLLGFPVCWVLGEWVRSWILSGFPWLLTGTSQLHSPLAGWLPLAGPYAVGLIVTCTASALLVASSAWRRHLPLLLAVVALWTFGGALQAIEWTKPSGAPLQVALIQGNTPQELKWEPEQRLAVLRNYRELSARHWNADLLVWPEAALPAVPEQIPDYLKDLAAHAAAGKSALIFGIPTLHGGDDGRRQIFNSLLTLGAASGEYHKRRLVPFGEYLPLESLLRGLIDFFDLPRSHMSPGPARQAPLHLNGLTIAPYICYEIAYPDLVAQGAAGAELLLTVSNDTWFGRSIGPLQHLQLAQLRAREAAKPVIRATNNGISALIDYRGRVTARGGRFTREVIAGEIQPMTGRTPYTRWRSWPVLGLCLLIFAAIARQRLPG